MIGQVRRVVAGKDAESARDLQFPLNLSRCCGWRFSTHHPPFLCSSTTQSSQSGLSGRELHSQNGITLPISRSPRQAGFGATELTPDASNAIAHPQHPPIQIHGPFHKNAASAQSHIIASKCHRAYSHTIAIKCHRAYADSTSTSTRPDQRLRRTPRHIEPGQQCQS